jgi:hypothetical protein
VSKRLAVPQAALSSSGAGWSEIISYAEAQLKMAKLRENQLKALISVFKWHQEAGDICPSDLVSSTLKGRP